MITSAKTAMNFTLIILFLLTFCLFFIPAETFAQTQPAAQGPNFVPLVGIPGITDLGRNTTIPQYINAIYLFVIAAGAILGVIKIAYAGFKYSLSDVITDKASAKKDILGVFLGLAILLIPYIVLYTINPNLTNLDVLKGISPIPGGGGGAGGAGGTPVNILPPQVDTQKTYTTEEIHELQNRLGQDGWQTTVAVHVDPQNPTSACSSWANSTPFVLKAQHPTDPNPNRTITRVLCAY